MKTAVVALTLVLLTTTTLSSQQTDAKSRLMRKGRITIWSGVVLIGAGALAVPVTAAKPTPNHGSDPSVTGFGLVAAGGTLIWWGVQDQRRAAQPSTTFGVTIGRTNGIQIRRYW